MCGNMIAQCLRFDSSSKACEQTCARKGPRARAPGAMNGEKNGIASVAGLLLNDISMLPALLVLA